MTNMAKMELDVLHLLAKQPMAPKELARALPYEYNQVKYTVQNLRESDCVYRMPGTHKMALVVI